MTTNTTTAIDRPYWYETDDVIVCGPCRRQLLDDWSPEMVRLKGGNDEETCRPSDFRPLGRTPWAGSEPGDRYMQCDNCLGQWGPDAY